MLTKCIYSEALLAQLNHNSHKILRNVDNIIASLFQNNWLSWQDPNHCWYWGEVPCLQKWYLSMSLANLRRVALSDVKQRQKLPYICVYRNGIYHCHLPTFQGLFWVTWNNDRSFEAPTPMATGQWFGFGRNQHILTKNHDGDDLSEPGSHWRPKMGFGQSFGWPVTTRLCVLRIWIWTGFLWFAFDNSLQHIGIVRKKVILSRETLNVTNGIKWWLWLC